MFNVAKRDHWYAGVAGFITACFLTVILVTSKTPIRLGPLDVPYWVLFIFLPIAEACGYYVASKLFSNIHGLRQFGRYVVVGAMNFSVDTGILSVLGYFTGIYEGVLLVPLNAVSGTIAITNSYFWNRTWTFTRKMAPHTKEFVTFVVVTIIGFFINTSVVYVLTKIIPAEGFLTPQRLLVLAKLGATTISVLWNFLGYKFIVFRVHKDLHQLPL